MMWMYRAQFLLLLVLSKETVLGNLVSKKFVKRISYSDDPLASPITRAKHEKKLISNKYTNIKRDLSEYFWTRVGADIDGEDSFDQFGYSLALSDDKTTLAVGAFRNDGQGIDAGHVRVYRLDISNNWTQIGTDLDGDSEGDMFGTSVAVSSDGTIVAVGGVMHADGAGIVKVYQLNENGIWEQLGGDIVGDAAGDNLGRSVALSDDGNILAIGAPMYDSNTHQDCGQVRIYQLSEMNSFIQLGQDIVGKDALSSFGFSLDLSADGLSVVIGMAMSGVNSGFVTVLEYDSTRDEWLQLGEVIEDVTGVSDFFGMSVSISAVGHRVAVGAPFSDANGKDSGLVAVYELINDSWYLLGHPIIGEAAGDTSGVSVDLSNDGDIVVVGGFMNSGMNGMFSGHVRVYMFRHDSWTILGEDLDGEFSMDLFGRSVSISGDGKMVAIGGPLNDGYYGSDSGHVRVFNLEMQTHIPSRTPTSMPSIIPTTTDIVFKNGSWFQYGQTLGGYDVTSKVSISSSGEYLAISEPSFGCSDGSNCGKVEIYSLLDNTWVLSGDAILGSIANGRFGISLQLSSDGRYIVIGSIVGYVTVYRRDGYSWSQVGEMILEETPNDLAGLSVSIGGTESESVVIAIGAPYNDGSGEDAGHARVYELSAQNTWVQVGSDIDGANAFDYFGKVVCLSKNGKVIAVSSASFPSTSYVKVFQRNSSDEWEEVGEQIQSADATDLFGNSLSLSENGRLIAVGAPFADSGGVNSGAVKVYEFTANTWSQTGQEIYEAPGENFGFSVSLSEKGNILAVGSSLSQSARIYQIVDKKWMQLSFTIDGLGMVSISGDGTRVAGSGLGLVKSFGLKLLTHQPSIFPSVNSFQPSRSPSGSPTAHSSNPSTVSFPTQISTIFPSAVTSPSTTPSFPSEAPTEPPVELPTMTVTQRPSSNTSTSSPSIVPSLLKVTSFPSTSPTELPTLTVTPKPSLSKSVEPSASFQSIEPSSSSHTSSPSESPTELPTIVLTSGPSLSLSFEPSLSSPSMAPSYPYKATFPSNIPTEIPTNLPTSVPSHVPTLTPRPSLSLSFEPSVVRPSSHRPSLRDAIVPSIMPSLQIPTSGSPSGNLSPPVPSHTPSLNSNDESLSPSHHPSFHPSSTPSSDPTDSAVPSASMLPTLEPTLTIHPTHNPSLSLAPSKTSDKELKLDYWSQIGESIFGLRDGDSSGFSISLSSDGKCVAVGSPNSDLVETNAGNVRVFQRNESGRWEQLGNILTGNNSNARFGISVDISESCLTVVVGATFQFNDGGIRTGAAEIYRLIEGQWVKIGKTIVGDRFGDRTGQSVAISADGNIVAIASAFSDDTTSSLKDNGKVQIFKYLDLEDSLIQIGQDLIGNSTDDYFGFSIALSDIGDKLVIGAKGADTLGQNSENGRVQVFQLIDNTWIQIGQSLEGKNQNDQFGYSVSISADGNKIAVGSPFHDDEEKGANSGLVQVFQFLEERWVLTGNGIVGVDSEALSGWSISLSGDGNLVAVGSLSNNPNNAGLDTGHVRIFRFTGNEWTQVGKDLNGESSTDFFGYDVSLSGDGMTLAASGTDGGGTGVVKIFELLLIQYPSSSPTASPSNLPSRASKPSNGPSVLPSENIESTNSPRSTPSSSPSATPTLRPIDQTPTLLPSTNGPSNKIAPTMTPNMSISPSKVKSIAPSGQPSIVSSDYPTVFPSVQNSTDVNESSNAPTALPSSLHSLSPSLRPTAPQGDNYWTQIASLDGDSPDDFYGFDIAFSNSAQTIAIGAMFDDNARGANVGSVKIFRYNNNSYQQLGSILEGRNPNDNFGTSVALSSDGNTCVIGIPGYDGSTGSSSGAAAVFTLTTNGVWVQKGSLIEGIQGGEKAGISVDISDDGNVIAIGAQLNNNANGESSGQVRVLEFRNVNGIRSWVQVGSAILGENRGDGFGTALSLSGDGRTIGIGGPLNTISYYEGHVRVFRWTEAEWLQLGSDIDGDVPVGQFGGRISLSKDGNVVGIGMSNGSFSAVRMYRFINGQWNIMGVPLDGYSVALSNDGLTAAVGSFTGIGQVTVFKFINNNWVQVGETLQGDVIGSRFGESVALSGDGSFVAGGAPNQSGGNVKIYYDKLNSSSVTWLRSGGQQIFPPYSSGSLVAMKFHIIAGTTLLLCLSFLR